MRKFNLNLTIINALFLCAFCLPGCTSEKSTASQEPAIDLTKPVWYGKAISYSGYREGQNPQKEIYPSQAEILQDLRIVEKNWKLIRTYGSDQHSEDILQVSRRENIALKVMLGAWLDGEPGYEADNARQVQNCIRLANAYPDIVIAVNVGNEILVNWSSHKVPEEKVIAYVKQVQAAVDVPVTVADDYSYWRESNGNLIDVVDFITMHSYPAWHKLDIDTAMAFTIATYEDVRKVAAGKNVVIGEAGWPTYTEGELHVPRAGDETKQKRYYEELNAWAEKNKVTVFYFEAFDEPWKGSGTEGHWGLFSEKRKAKPVMQALYPDLMPAGLTSPGYDDAN